MIKKILFFIGFIPYILSQELCPQGYYRQKTQYTLRGAKRIENCLACPRGKYGINQCSNVCPKGRYGANSGSINKEDCLLCPTDTYSSQEGFLQCTTCPIGRYNPKVGSISQMDCIECPENYYGHQCYKKFLEDYQYSYENKPKGAYSSFMISSQQKTKIEKNTQIYKEGCGGGFKNICGNQHISYI